MSAGIPFPQKLPASWETPADEEGFSPDSLPISPDDLLELGVESHLIPSVISAMLRAEQSPNDSPLLSLVEAKNLIENLDKVVSSAAVNASLKDRCFKALRKVSPAHSILPESYFPAGVTLNDSIPYASGGFADVWKGERNGNQVRIKAFRAQALVDPDKIKRRFYREIVAWKYLSHPNVVPLLGVSETLFSFSIISPWLPNGGIIEYIQKHLGVNRLQLLVQAACGLEYLHSLRIVHCSINPGNILITEEGNARLGDFGITGIITDHTVVERDSMAIPVARYMAPELLNPRQFGRMHSTPSKESDVHSFAMTAYEVLSGLLPYGVRPESVTALNIVSGNRPHRPRNQTADRWLHDSTWDIMRLCWDQAPESRLSIDVLHRALVESELEQRGDTPTRGDGASGDQTAIREREAKEKPEAQRLIDIMDEERALKNHAGSEKERSKLFNELCKTCSRQRLLPGSMRIPDRSWESNGDDCYGGHATVFKCTYEGRQVAVKVPRVDHTSDFDSILGRLYREAVAWKHLQHPNILPLLGVTLAERRFAMVSEWMEDGNINNFIQRNPDANRAELLVDVAKGLAYMHGHHLVHGDLKGANILINKDRRACISDFDLSTVTGVRARAATASLSSLLSNDTLMSFTSGGTGRWMSPELIDPERFGIQGSEGYRPTRQSDCYALGMVIYEVLCGHIPYHDFPDDIAVIVAVMEGVRPKKPENAAHLGFTEELWDTVKQCWLEDWKARPGVEDILSCLNGAPPSWQTRRRVIVRKAITALFGDSE